MPRFMADTASGHPPVVISAHTDTTASSAGISAEPDATAQRHRCRSEPHTDPVYGSHAPPGHTFSGRRRHPLPPQLIVGIVCVTGITPEHLGDKPESKWRVDTEPMSAPPPFYTHTDSPALPLRRNHTTSATMAAANIISTATVATVSVTRNDSGSKRNSISCSPAGTRSARST